MIWVSHPRICDWTINGQELSIDDSKKNENNWQVH